MWAWPDLHGCTGVAWDVTDFGAGAFFRTAGMAGTAGACFVCVASGAGAADGGCMHGAGVGDAGCAAEKWWLDRACSVAVVPLGTVSAALTLHSQRCLCMWQYVEPLLVHTRKLLHGRMCITVAGTQIFQRVSYVATG